MTTTVWGLIAGTFLVGAGQFWSLHQSDAINVRFWVGVFFAAIYPVGTLLIGLYQPKPGSKP